jgi:hypothetical protein
MLSTHITLSRSEDQQKIRLAVLQRRVDPGDVPESAKIRESSSVHTAAEAIAHPSKRTATQAGLDHPNAPVISQTSSSSSTFQPPEEVEEVTEDEIRDELYCIMTTTVVGIQYYKGWPKVTCPYHPFIHQTSYRYGWARRGSPLSERTSKQTRQVWLPVTKWL